MGKQISTKTNIALNTHEPRPSLNSTDNSRVLPSLKNIHLINQEREREITKQHLPNLFYLSGDREKLIK